MYVRYGMEMRSSRGVKSWKKLKVVAYGSGGRMWVSYRENLYISPSKSIVMGIINLKTLIVI